MIRVDNDANLMAIGSHKEGLAKNVSDFILSRWDGYRLRCVLPGTSLSRFSSCAGHIGHTCVDFNGPVCRCGNRGCLEALVGGPGIAEAAEEVVTAGESEIMQSLKADHDGLLTAVEVGEAAAMRDPAALQIIRRAGTLIGTVLAGVINLYNPELIVIGGGISKIGNLLLAEIRREVLKRAYSYTPWGCGSNIHRSWMMSV